MDYLKFAAGAIYDTFWSESIWLPNDTKWEDLEKKKLENTDDLIYPDSSDLYMVLPVSIILFFVRIFTTKYILRPFGEYCGLKANKPLRAHEENETLNTFYKQNRKPTKVDITKLTEAIGWPRRKVERWFRLKRNSNKHCQLEKFTETGFLTLIHSFMLIYGIFVQHDEEFFYDVRHSYRLPAWPLDSIKPKFRSYYILAMSWATSLLISIFFLDVRRRDFYVQACHHIATVSLFYISWVVNCVNIGLVVLIINDAIHPFLNASKMLLCLKRKQAASVTFVVFMVVWVYTRLYLHGHLVLVHLETYYQFIMTRGHCYVVHFGTGLMVLLQCIHFMYTKVIFQVAWNRIARGQYGDTRSASEQETDDEIDEVQNGRKHD